MWRPALALGLLLSSVVAQADALDDLLAKGPVVLVENDAKGKFLAATAIVAINAPIQHVWDTLIDYEKYKQFIPKIVSVKYVKGAGTADPSVRWELDTPVFNTIYTVRYHIDPVAHAITGDWADGALKNSHWEWHLEATGPNRTLLYHKTQTRNFSDFIERFEDSQQSITIGVNVGAAVSVLRAMKTRCESQ